MCTSPESFLFFARASTEEISSPVTYLVLWLGLLPRWTPVVLPKLLAGDSWILLYLSHENLLAVTPCSVLFPWPTGQGLGLIQSFGILTSLPCFSYCGKSSITESFNYFHFNTSFIDFLDFPRQKVNFLTFKDFPKQHVFQCIVLCQLWSFQFIRCCLEIKGLKQKYSLLIHYFWRIGIT